jgi:hypothetical protein
MGINATVSAPHPLMDYTVKFNRQAKRNEELHRIWNNQWKDYYDLKLKDIQEKRRVEKIVELKDSIEQIHRYENIVRKDDYANYRYQFYIGTKIDCYI